MLALNFQDAMLKRSCTSLASNVPCVGEAHRRLVYPDGQCIFDMVWKIEVIIR